MAFTCPVCHRTSYNPNDEKAGYCGSCHAFTGIPQYEDYGLRTPAAKVPKTTSENPFKDED